MEVEPLDPEIIQDVLSTTIEPISAESIDPTFKSQYTDLISKALNSKILAFSDEWFASATNLTTPTPPIRKPGVFTHAGAWYDGWETRRHNPEPFDWVIIRLGVASGRVAGVEVDTAYFSGNHAPEVRVVGCFEEDDGVVLQHKADGDPDQGDDAEGGFWTEILPKQECGPSQRHGWKLPKLTENRYTHVRLQMYPDGGIARFRLYGVAVPVFPNDSNEVFDLAACVNGGVAVRCSDQHFGSKDNLLLPGRGVDMGDGWETKRSRGEHVDWTVIRLGCEGEIEKVIIDTAHFRGNYPQKVRVLAAKGEKEPSVGQKAWKEILPPQKTGPDVEHVYERDALTNVEGMVYGWVQLIMIPDGGIKRIRVLGRRKA